jgi:CheY-like chemotaxis protein
VGDDQRLAQVLTNLLSNAVKFTPLGGDIRLAASLAEEADGHCELRIEVADNGIGISAAQKEKLFSVFEQVSNEINREYGGTGLGLAITKRIVELMGGRIWVESELGRGARFFCTVNVFRVNRNDDARCVSEADSAADGDNFRGLKLLVAEDMELNREILITLLEGTGLTIDCAKNGKEALEMIESSPDKYDLVFMDIQMPLMDGFEAARRIRARPGHRRESLPIIAMTANVFKSDIEECLAAGMDDHIGKPLDTDKLLGVLRKYLGTNV